MGAIWVIFAVFRATKRDAFLRPFLIEKEWQLAVIPIRKIEGTFFTSLGDSSLGFASPRKCLIYIVFLLLLLKRDVKS